MEYIKIIKTISGPDLKDGKYQCVIINEKSKHKIVKKVRRLRKHVMTVQELANLILPRLDKIEFRLDKIDKFNQYVCDVFERNNLH